VQQIEHGGKGADEAGQQQIRSQAQLEAARGPAAAAEVCVGAV